MIADRRLPLISATGSTRMGFRIGEVVGKRLGRTILELGGNNAIIITPDADLKLALPAVVFVEASQILLPAHDISVPETKAPAVWSSYQETGAGVIVGVIDSGIDPFHPDFIKPDGTTRIKYLLDFSDPGDPDSDGDLEGNVFGGTLYSEAQINAAIANPGWFYSSTDTPMAIPDNNASGVIVRQMQPFSKEPP